MDKQQDRKNHSEEARLKRKLILHKKGLNIYRRSSESGNKHHHANDDNHFSKPAMYIEIGRQSMTKTVINGTPLSDNSKDQETSFPNHNVSTARFGQPLNSDNLKDQETSFPNHNISTARFGQPLNSGRHIIREKHYVSPGRPGIRTTHLEVVKDNSKDLETSFPNHNISTARFGQPLNSGRHIIREKHYVSPGEPGNHTTQLEVVKGSKVCSVIAMKSSFPWDGQVLDPSHKSTSSDIMANPIPNPNLPTIQIPLPNPSIDINSQDELIRRASMYQDYMEQIPIPTLRGSVIPFTSWMGLGRSIKKLYGQPLHYLTNIRLKQWDKLRIGSEDEYKPLDEIIHPCKAEATIWLMEQVHRQTSSHIHIANSWKMDPMYNGSVDSIFPALEHTS